MANVNAQSVEDYADRIVYRFPGGRYEQVLTNWASAFTTGLKTLVNTDTDRSYVVPTSGINAKFFKIDLSIYIAVSVTLTSPSSFSSLTKSWFLRVSIPTLNMDGKSQLTEFYQEKTEFFYTSQQLRAINISNILVEPVQSYTDLRNTMNVTTVQFDFASALTQLVGIVQPTVTFFKK